MKSWFLAMYVLAAVGLQPSAGGPPCPPNFFFKVDVVRPSPSERRGYAAFLLTSFERFFNVVPELSPREADWLSQELAASLNRQGRAGMSLLFDQSVAKSVSRDAVELLRVLSAGSFESERKEARLWASVATNLMNSGFASATDRLAGEHVIADSFAGGPRKAGVPRNEMLDYTCREHSQLIMNRIVLPYLESPR